MISFQNNFSAGTGGFGSSGFNSSMRKKFGVLLAFFVFVVYNNEQFMGL